MHRLPIAPPFPRFLTAAPDVGTRPDADLVHCLLLKLFPDTIVTNRRSVPEFVARLFTGQCFTLFMQDI